MDRLNKEYKELIVRPTIYGSSSSRPFYTVWCGGIVASTSKYRCVINYRKWEVEQRRIYKVIHNFKNEKTDYLPLPRHYYCTRLIPELPYKANDIIFWQWILRHFLEINELRLMIIYRIITGWTK